MERPTHRIFEGAIRLGQAAQNALEVARFGGLDTDEEPATFEIVDETRMYRLRRYSFDRGAGPRRPPIILVPPMMLAADVYDVSPQSSAVRDLADHGVDPWVVDFGAPEEEEGGLERTLTDHVIALSGVIDLVVEQTGGPVHLAGYSQGGMFCYQTAAYRRGDDLASLITFGSPVDQQQIAIPGITDEQLVNLLDFLADNVLDKFTLPAWASRLGFRMMDPMKTVQQQTDFLLRLHDREALLPREGQRRFLMDEGWVAYPGPAIAELVKQFIVSNRMLNGGFVIDGRPVTLADIDCPILCFVGTKDTIAPPAVVRAVAIAAPRAETHESVLETGHFGLVVGSKASGVTWPTVARWMRHLDGDGEQPEAVERLTPADAAVTRRRRSDIERSLELATNLTTGVGRVALAGLRQSGRGLRALVEEAADQLPRLNRINQVRPDTRVSLAKVLDEQARAAPEDPVFLFEGRGHTYGAANKRIDNVVRGLLSLGVRRGEHVGVLMDTRPSALGVVAALNRIGAVAVMLRPDGDTAREARLSDISRIVADPEHGDQATDAGVRVHVLGGGGGPRDLGSAVDDMEAIDPDAVRVPGWYRPDPGLARDLAFIMFTGAGEHTRVSRISNGRWALSAFGTASSGSLTRADTVLSVTPIHHPSALLTGIGGAIASRARLAMIRSFEPEEFWESVRRNGVTVVTYTWTMCADLLALPRSIDEQHHPIRLFMGSGMPRGVWEGVERRFAPATVLEFYASTEGEAVLVNVARKVGSLGRRLPGSAQLRVAKYDIDTGKLVEGRDGYAVECRDGEVGMLLARLETRHGASVSDKALRAMFEPDDAWLDTGDLVRRDSEGDHWLIGGVGSLIRTPHGAVPPIPVQASIAEVEAVHLSVAYGVTTDHGTEVAAAVMERRGATVTAEDLTEALAGLPAYQRPRYVRIVDEIPRTTWYRVRTGPLRAEGVPTGGRFFRYDPETAAYRPGDTAASPAKRSSAKKAAATKQPVKKKTAGRTKAAAKKKTPQKKTAAKKKAAANKNPPKKAAAKKRAAGKKTAGD